MRQLQTAETAAQWLRARVTGTIHTDSRKLRSGDGFIAWPGATTDARQHVAAALAGGATDKWGFKIKVTIHGYTPDIQKEKCYISIQALARKKL